MNTFKLKILAADKVVFDGECEKMTIPCFDGERVFWLIMKTF